MWNTCGTGINLSRLSHINVMDLKNLKRQATSRAALKLMQITRCSPDFFSVDTMFYFLFMIHDLHSDARHTLQLTINYPFI